MPARYKFWVGPANRNSDYAQSVTVIGEDHAEAKAKAIAFRGFRPNDTSVWLRSVEEIEPQTDILERLAELLREKKESGGNTD